MKYVLICRDGTDEGAMDRRLSAREKHLSDIQENENFVFGTAIIEDEKMVGSVMVMDFENEKELEAYLASEVYMTAGVWKTVEKVPCAAGFFGKAFGK